MDFLLQPFHQGKANKTTRVPYVCSERYDGSPWTSYPTRKGRAELSLVDGDVLNDLETIRFLRVNPIPVAEQESFLQKWLYFGLIAEFLGANSGDLEDRSSVKSPDTGSSKDILDTIYNTVLFQEHGASFVVLENDGLQKFVNIAMSKIPQDIEAQRAWYIHLNRCLAHTHSVLSISPKEMNHTIRFSIAAIGEVFTYIVLNGLRGLKDQTPTARSWTTGYFNNEAKLSMMENGWCPSSIARCEAKLASLQSQNMIQKMDKSMPIRDHTKCTEYVCSATQIDLKTYHVGHRVDDCQCGDALAVDSDEITKILFDGDKIPLLRFVGGLQDLRVEIVESTPKSKYIAISHVWADGLGNPRANALHRCKLHHLRELVAGVANEASPQEDLASPSAPLIWIDTLCCPAMEGDGKNKGIEKIYNVYEKAEHVLVLDSELMSYAVQPQDISEQAMRIFTSPWVRRLWTLQEGALANSLYFQFADKAISVQKLYTMFPEAMVVSLQHQSLCMDFVQEYWNLQGFFHGIKNSDGTVTRDLGYLDRALQFRGVSVATDEPLCIGALMQLDLPEIINTEPKTDRMQVVWKLLASSMGGLPAQMIFFEEQKIDAPGWRWAPRSLLQFEKGIFAPGTRVIRWAETRRGMRTPHGLRVKYRGYRIKMQRHGDGRLQNPWPGFTRIAEAYMNFKDAQTGQRYFVGDKMYAFMSQNWTDDQERREYNKLGLFPLHDMADRDDSLIICNSTSHDAIFATPMRCDVTVPVEEDGLHVRAERHIIVFPVNADDGYISNTIRKLALRLRDDKMTDTHIDNYKRLLVEVGGGSSDVIDQKMSTDEEFKASLEALRQRMKDMIIEVIAQDARFVDAVTTQLGESALEGVWVFISNFFRGDYIGTPLSSDQAWVVD